MPCPLVPAIGGLSTSNDIGWKFPQDSGIWAAADLLGRPIEHSYDIDPDRTMLTVRYRFHAPSLPRLDVAVSYTVNSKGEILVSAQYNGISGQPLLPEFGLRFALNKDLEYFSYFGPWSGRKLLRPEYRRRFGLVSNHRPGLPHSLRQMPGMRATAPRCAALPSPMKPAWAFRCSGWERIPWRCPACR